MIYLVHSKERCYADILLRTLLWSGRLIFFPNLMFFPTFGEKIGKYYGEIMKEKILHISDWNFQTVWKYVQIRPIYVYMTTKHGGLKACMVSERFDINEWVMRVVYWVNQKSKDWSLLYTYSRIKMCITIIVYQLMGVLCDRLKFGSTSALDLLAKTKTDIAKKVLVLSLVLLYGFYQCTAV